MDTNHQFSGCPPRFTRIRECRKLAGSGHNLGPGTESVCGMAVLRHGQKTRVTPPSCHPRSGAPKIKPCNYTWGSKASKVGP